MAVREIKTRLSIDGEQEFNREIAAAEREVRQLGKELKLAATEFEENGEKQEYLAKRSRLLHQQLQQQEKEWKALNDAISGSKYEEGDRRLDRLKSRLTNLEIAMSKTRRTSAAADKELEEFGRDATRVGRQIENGITEAADDASRSLQGMMSSIAGDISDIRGMGIFDMATDIGGQVIDIATGLYEFGESSREYRRQMSYLELGAMKSGENFELIKSKMYEVTAATGDMDAAIEGINMLMSSELSGNTLMKWIDSLMSISVLMPDAMKFENLAESLVETLATGTATGQIAEFFDKMGFGAENLTKLLQEAETYEGREQALYAMIGSDGVAEDYELWKALNEEIVKAEAASMRLKTAWNELGGTVDTALTPAIDKLAEMVELVNDLLDEETRGEALEKMAENVKQAIGPETAEMIGATLNPAYFAKERAAKSGEKYWYEEWVEALNVASFGIGNSSQLSGVSSSIGAYLGEKIREWYEQAITYDWDGIDTYEKNEPAFTEEQLAGIYERLYQKALEGVDATPTPEESEIIEYFRKNNPDLDRQVREMVEEQILEKLETIPDEAARIGDETGINLAEGFASEARAVEGEAYELANSINRAMDTVTGPTLYMKRVYTESSSGQTTTSNGNYGQHFTMEVDGRTFADVVLPYIDSAMGGSTADAIMFNQD